MKRLTIISIFSALVLLASATPANAQYWYGAGPGMYGGFTTRGFYPIPPTMFGGLPPLQPVRPLPGINYFNPLMFNPFNRNYNPQIQAATTYYYLNRYSAPAYSGPSALPVYSPSYSGTGYMTGGTVNPQLYAAQQDLSRAQYAAGAKYSSSNARTAIAGQWAYEQRAPAAPPAEKPMQDDALTKALAAADSSKLISGEYLNRIAAAVTGAEGRGGKGAAPQIGPPLLNRIQFAGSPEADALNVIRRAGRLDFPAAFESVDALRALRPVLDKDIVAIATAAKLGKPIDPSVAANLSTDVKMAQDALIPAINTLPFDDAVAARRFLNQLDATARVMRDPKSAGLLNPQWETTGVSIAELVKHMTKYKLQFGPANADDEEAYAAVHQALAAYLFTLNQSLPQKK